MNPVVAMQRAHQCLEYVGLGEQRYRQIDGYSTGMRQATKLACAIVHDPEMIIADEPSNGLDAAARDFMLQTLDTTVRNGQRSVLMASHLMDDVEQVCERIVLLHKGRLVAEGRIEDLKAIDREYEVHVWGAAESMERGLLDRGLRVRRQGRVMRVADDRDDVPREVLEVAATTGSQVRRLHTYEASLEDLFIAIMERLGHDVKSSEDLLAGGAPR
jgi:ABC-2 type transport system ATP-binding protein